MGGKWIEGAGRILRGDSREGARPSPRGRTALCASPGAAYTIVDGKVLVRKGRLTTFDLERVARRHDELALQMTERARS